MADDDAAAGVAGGSDMDTTFPVWDDAKVEDILAGEDDPRGEDGKFVDLLDGTAHPAAMSTFLVDWVRPERLLEDTPDVPVVVLRAPPEEGEGGEEGKESKDNTEDEMSSKGNRNLVDTHCLYWGTPCVEWLATALRLIYERRDVIPPGYMLWENIWPKHPETQNPIPSPTGKYVVRMFVMNQWRCVVVDDRLPVDLFGATLGAGSRPLMSWPGIITKAVFKLMKRYGVEHLASTNEVPITQWLTGWDRENLGLHTFENGQMYDSLFDALRRNKRRCLPTVTLRNRFLLPKPPRIVCLTGPAGIGKTIAINTLVQRYPSRFGRCVASTSRAPGAHETQGAEFLFLPRAEFRDSEKKHKFLETSVVQDPRLGFSSDHHIHPDDRKLDGAPYKYGISFHEITRVAAGGKVLLASTDLPASAFLKSQQNFETFVIRCDCENSETLASVLKKRLRVHESTVASRIAFAKREWEVAQPGGPAVTLGDDATEEEKEQEKEKQPQDKYHAVLLANDPDQLFYQFKVRCAELSPVVRNRLLGLPSYILDYADVIPANKTQKPKVKPVVVSGPNFLEKNECVRRVYEEFGDEVFAFPQIVTTEPVSPKFPSEDDPETETGTDDSGGNDAENKENDANEANSEISAGSKKPDSNPGHPWSARRMTHVSDVDFEAAHGDYACVWQTQFAHAEVTYKYAILKSSLTEAAQDEKLVLVNTPSVETLDSFMSFCASDTSVAPAGGAMAIFLGPATMEEHEKRLRAYMTESKESIAAQVLVAEQDLKQGVDSQVFDAFLTVADFHLQNSTEKDTEALHETVDALAELISGKRPDMIKPSDSAAEAGKVIRPLVVCGPSEAGKKQLVELLLKEFPKRFAKVKTTTTRLPRDWETGEAGVLGDSETNLEKEQPETDSVGPRYHFVSKETFEADVANGKFLEHTTRSPASTDEARAAGETAGETPTETVSPETFSYGVAMDAFESACENGAVPILDVDVFGVRALKLLYPEGVFVCVAPADVEALERKIREREDLANRAADENENDAATGAAGDDAEGAAGGEVDAAADAEAARLAAEADADAVLALELRIAFGVDKIVRAMDCFDEPNLFTETLVVDETEEFGFSHESEKNALACAFGDFKLCLWNSPLGPHVKSFLAPPPRPLVVAGPLGSRREKTFELLLTEFPEKFGFPIGVTTRAPEEGEINGVHYEFITQTVFDQRVANGEFMECTEVIVGYDTWDEETQSNPPIKHAYGVTTREVKRVRGLGKMPILETDVAGALAMKEAGLDAVYVFFEHPVGGHPVSASDETGCNGLSASETRGNASAEETFTKHNQTHVDNLKLAGETAATIDARVAEAAFELKSATEAGDLFNLRLPHDTDELRRYAKLKEIIALKEPDITPVSSVWGFGRPRWDVRERKHGYLPLRVAVIGPAASGKSTAARALASRYDLPLIYPGALLRAAAYDTPTPLGVEAKRYLDSTQTVPDDFMMKLVWQRIQKEDCRRKGFLLDGFPHNHYQATELQKHGIFLDKVLVLEMDTKSVIARTEGRLIDPVTGNTYHKDFAPPSDDEPEVQQRVVTRHDDEETNVRARLAKYDFSNAPVRSQFPHVSFYLDGNKAPDQVLREMVEFIELEDALHDTRVITPVLSLPSLEYEITRVGKYRGKSVLNLLAPGCVCETREAPVWVDLQELMTTAREVILNTDPGLYEHTVCDLRTDLTSLGPGGKASQLGKMIHVDSEEPVELVVSVTLAPREPPAAAPTPAPLALCGDGAELLAKALCDLYPDVYEIAELQELPPAAEPDADHDGEEKTDAPDGGDAEKEVTENEDSPADERDTFLREAYPGANHSKTLMRSGLCPVVWLDASEAGAFKQAVLAALEADAAGEGAAPAESDAAASAEPETPSPAKNAPTVICVGMPPPPKAADDADDPDDAEPAEDAEEGKNPSGENSTGSGAEKSPFDAIVYPPSSNSCVPTLELLKGVPSIAARLALRRAPSSDPDDLCAVLVRDYDWHASGSPTRILCNLTTTTHCTSLIKLTRGRHVLQLSVDPGFYFNAAVRSRTPFAMDEPAKLLAEKELAAPVVTEGTYGAAQPGDFVVWFRRVFTCGDADATLASCLEIADPVATPFARFAVVNNDDAAGDATHFPAGAVPGTKFAKNEFGYTLMAYCKTLVPLNPGKWRLSALSESPLGSFETEDRPGNGWEDKETFVGQYQPNYALTACRFRVQLKKRCLISFHFETDIPCGFKAVFVDPEDGWETKQAEYLRGGHQGHLVGIEKKRWNAYGALTCPSVVFDATNDGYFVFEVKLVPERTSFSIDTNGDVPSPISWKLTTYSTEHGDTKWQRDDAREQYYDRTVANWNSATAERALAAQAALLRRIEERELKRSGENVPPVTKPIKVGKDAEVTENSRVITLGPYETRRTSRAGGETVTAARAAAAATYAAYATAGKTATAKTDVFGNTLGKSSTLGSRGTGLLDVPFIEQVTIPPDVYAARETKLTSSIEASKQRLLAFVQRRDAEKEKRSALAETKKGSFQDWRQKETAKRKDDDATTWRAKRAAYLQSVKPAPVVSVEAEGRAAEGGETR